MSEINKQTSKAPFWFDDKNISIPYNRTTKHERKCEKYSFTLFKKASAANKQLSQLKDFVREVCEELHDEYMADNNIKKPSKGNFTWYNFDRSLKIEVNITERIDFDDLTIKACKEKLDEFLNNNIEVKDKFIKEMVMDAFETNSGKLDARKVMGLLRHKSRIKSEIFQEAMKLLESSIRRPDSKTYFRIWARNEEGKYENIDLNFSSI